MPAPTQPVTIDLADFGGPDLDGITVTAYLDRIDYTADGVFVSTAPVSGDTVAGRVVLNLFPNATEANGGLGTVGSLIRVVAQIPNSRALDVLAAIPDQPCNLVDYIVSNEPLGLSGSERAASDAQAWRDLAKKWATQTDAEVEAGQGYGAKKYAQDAAAAAALTALDRIATGEDRVNTAADRLATTNDRQEVASVAAEALAALAQVESDIYFDLLAGRTNGMRIDATLSNVAAAVKVLDTTTPANNVETSIREFLGASAFTSPKLCKQSDGTWRWSPHNDILRSKDFANASWAKVGSPTLTPDQIGPDGVTADATLITSGGTTCRLEQNLAVLVGHYRTQGFYIKLGTSPWVAVEVVNNAVTMRCWVDAAGNLGTVDAGFTGPILSTVDDNGNALAAGWFYLAPTNLAAGTNNAIKVIMCEANGGTATVAGRTMTIARAQAYRGVRRLPYLETTSAAVRDTPYDWSNGKQQLVLDTQVAYKGRTNRDFSAWTLDGITLSDVTGPDGTPCKRLTATKDDATATLAVTSSGTWQMFHALVRRGVGAGALLMSNDNGATAKDVTASVGVGATEADFEECWNRSAVANPTVQFKIATNGDAFDIAFANVSQTTYVPAPAPANLIDYTQTTDSLSIADTKYPQAATRTFYADVYIRPDKCSISGASRVGFFGAGSVEASTRLNELDAARLRVEYYIHDGSAAQPTQNVGSEDARGRFQIQQRVVTAGADHAVCYNGEAPYTTNLPPALALTTFGMRMGERVWVNRILVVPEDITDLDDSLRTFKLDEGDSNVNSNLLATAYVCKFGTTPGAGISRIPSFDILYEREDVAAFVAVWGQVTPVGGANLEHPQRMLQRRGEFNLTTRSIDWWEDQQVILEHPNWASGGVPDYQGYTVKKIEHGPYTGMLLYVLVRQDGDYGATDKRNLYAMTSADNGSTRTAITKIADLTADFGVANGFVCTGENSTIFQYKTGPHAGRVVCSLNVNNQSSGVMWTDDFCEGGDGSGTHWSWTPAIGRVSHNVGFGTLTEPAVQPLPGGAMVLAFRNNNVGGPAAWSISNNYGMSFTAGAQFAGENTSTATNNGWLQADPDGGEGYMGRLMIARATADGRVGHVVQSLADVGMTLGNTYRLFPSWRRYGYSPMKKPFKHRNVFLMMSEPQPSVTSNTNTSINIVAFRYEAAA